MSNSMPASFNFLPADFASSTPFSEELHIFMSSYLQAIFEAVVHAQNKDEYRTYVENLNKFYNWEKILTD